MIRTIAMIAAGLVFSSIAAAAEVGPVQIEKSTVAFVSKQMGVPVEGDFKKFAVQLSFDPAKPEAGRAQIDIDMASIDAGSAEANEEVVGKNWFNVKQFPKASFVSSSVKPLGGGKFEVTGKLTIRDKTHDASAPFTMTAQGANVQFDGSFVIKRADFGIGQGAWSDFETVANEVQIKVKFAAAAKR